MGVKVECPRRGRRLAEAHAQVMGVLEGMLGESNDWAPGKFEGDTDLWSQCQGAVRFTHIYGKEKAAFLDKVPYLLARLAEEALRCIARV